jgi:hypothetical protein
MCGGIGGKVAMMGIETRRTRQQNLAIEDGRYIKLRWALQVTVYVLNGKTPYIRDAADDDSAPEG